MAPSSSFHPTKFLSTPSARRATRHPWRFFNLPHISIHALREEGDGLPSQTFSLPLLFLSTPSARRATALKETSDC